ncbi:MULTISPECIES: hypothetical protein [Haloferax]|uniref:hypothetical protein n=1 Tax=Haloferax TaxID=2251 RepID=UPI001781D702|nr:MULTISPECIES: hypothetical protein [Haloferax]
MNRTTVVAAGAAGGYGIAVFAAIAVFFQGASESIGVAVGFGLVTVIAIYAVTQLVLAA